MHMNCTEVSCIPRGILILKFLFVHYRSVLDNFCMAMDVVNDPDIAAVQMPGYPRWEWAVLEFPSKLTTFGPCLISHFLRAV